MKHLTHHERQMIERELGANTSLRQIALLLGKHPNTIGREIKARRILSPHKPYGRTKNAFLHRHGRIISKFCDPCDHPDIRFCCFRHDCNEQCPDFVEERCPRLEQSPYICNGCATRRTCTLRVRVYRATPADKKYREHLCSIRGSYCLTGEEFIRIDRLVGPRLRQAQSISFIVRDIGDELPCRISTIYRLVSDGEVEGVRNIDLPHKVRFKQRKSKRSFQIDPKARIGRSMEDYRRLRTSRRDGYHRRQKRRSRAAQSALAAHRSSSAFLA